MYVEKYANHIDPNIKISNVKHIEKSSLVLNCQPILIFSLKLLKNNSPTILLFMLSKRQDAVSRYNYYIILLNITPNNSIQIYNAVTESLSTLYY